MCGIPHKRHFMEILKTHEVYIRQHRETRGDMEKRVAGNKQSVGQ